MAKSKQIKKTVSKQGGQDKQFMLLLSLSVILIIIVGFGGLFISTKNNLSKNNLPTKLEDKVNYLEKTQPKEFPEDFPVYSSASVVSSWTTEADDSLGISVIYESEDSLKSITDFYLENLAKNSWEILEKSDTADSSIISFKKNDFNGFMGISAQDKTTISVTIAKENNN